MNKVYKFFKNLFFKPARSNQAFIDQCKPMDEVLKNMKDFQDKNKKIDYNPQYIRFLSLSSGHNLGRLTSEEEREFDNTCTVDMLHPWKREMIGMRMCNFI